MHSIHKSTRALNHSDGGPFLSNSPPRERTLPIDSCRVATDGRPCDGRGQDKDEYISSVAVGDAGHGHGDETPVRDLHQEGEW
jgi:hypothetical protein